MASDLRRRMRRAVTSSTLTSRRSLAGRTVALTGRTALCPRRELRELVRQRNGRWVEHVPRGLSWLVVGAGGFPLLPDGSISSKLARAEALDRGGAAIRIVSERTFLELLGALPVRADGGSRSVAVDEACRVLQVDAHALRRWEQLGLIRIHDGRLNFQDVVSLQSVRRLIADGVRADVISTNLERLRRWLPDVDRPLAQCSIVRDSAQRVLAELDQHLLSPDGQLYFRFDAADPRLDAGELRLKEEPQGAAAWFERAQEWESAEEYDAAADAYRRVLALEPHWPEAHFNLANALRAGGRPRDAEEALRAAIAVDPRLAVAWYNLADIAEDEGRYEEAASCLRRAIRAEPGFLDAHHNLALCLREMGRIEEAQSCWETVMRMTGGAPFGLPRA